MTTSDGFFTTYDGLRLFFKNVGEGPLVTLFLNGVPVIDDFSPLSANRTIVCFDPRHRGRSDAVRHRAQLERGVHHDVDDLDAIRRALGVDQVDVIGHSYAGVTAALYAIAYPAHALRIVRPRQPFVL